MGGKEAVGGFVEMSRGGLSSLLGVVSLDEYEGSAPAPGIGTGPVLSWWTWWIPFSESIVERATDEYS